MSRRTGLVATLTLALALATGGLGAPWAQAATVSSHLTFSPSAPTRDPGGSGTRIWGAASVTGSGHLDVRGRAVVTTPSRPNLNPGTSEFSFGLSIALTRGLTDSNLMQKGVWTGSQLKLSLHRNGGAPKVSCRVRGSAGSVHVFSPAGVVRVGSTWSAIRCHRVGSTVSLHVNGVRVASRTGPIGSVSSTSAYTIASKGVGAIADPDQYVGMLDDAYVRLGG